MQKTGKLELTWVGKYDDKVVEPRILIEDSSKSYGDPQSPNMLIHGDNLIALQALQNEFYGEIKCIYIDPPYNTGSAFDHYDDNLEHSIWLSLMRQRLILLRELLSEDGTIWIQIDDEEQAYLKVLCDEVFGRNDDIYISDSESEYSPLVNSLLGQVIRISPTSKETSSSFFILSEVVLLLLSSESIYVGKGTL